MSSEENPWLSIWVRPRATIRSIVEQNPKRSLWALAFIYGLTSLLNAFQSFPISVFIGLLPMFFFAIVLAPFWGYLFFSIWSWVIVFTGKLLKGQATFETARAAYAWSCVPLVMNIPLWLILILFFNPVIFPSAQEHVMLSGAAVTVLFLILLAKMVFAIWSLVAFLQTLAQVQQFSVLRSIGNVILASILLGVAFVILWNCAIFVTGAFGGHTATAALDWNSARTIVELIK